MAEIPDQPKRSASDFAHGVVKAAISGIPTVGGPAAELLGMIFGPPLERRREDWLNRLADAEGEIQDKVADLTLEPWLEASSF